MVERTLITSLREHFPDGDIPTTPGRTQLMLTLGLIEHYIVNSGGRRTGYLEDLKKAAEDFGLTVTTDDLSIQYPDLRFLYEKRITIENTLSHIPDIPLESSGALILLARGYDAAKPSFDTLYGATIYSRNPPAPVQDPVLRFTTAFLSFSHYYDRQDAGIAAEMSLFPTARHIVNGGMVPSVAGTFLVQLDPNKTTPNAIPALRSLMRKTPPGRRTPHEFGPRDLPPETVVSEYLQHFVAETSHGGSQYYAHFPRPHTPLLVFK